MAAANFGEQKAKAHAALGDGAIFAFQFLFALAGIARIKPACLLIGFDLTPYLAKFSVHHARRQLKIVQCVQLVEQRALGLGARLGEVLGLDALAQRVLHGGEIFHAKILGPGVVGRALLGRAHFDGGFKLGRFAGELAAP